MAKTRLYVAIETFFTDVDGQPVTVQGNITHVSGDSDLYKRFPGKFREAEPHFRGVEQATAAPGEVRHVDLPPAEEDAEDEAPTEVLKRK